MQSVDVGETYPIVTLWWDEDNDGVEPSAIDLVIDPPTGAQIVKTKADMTGSESVTGSGVDDTWTYPLDIAEEGVYRYTVTGTIAGRSVEQSAVLLAGADMTQSGPCEPWCTWDDVEAACPSDIDLSSIAAGEREALIDVASGILYSLDGRRFPGICEATRRICRTCGSCPAQCCCVPRIALDLGGRWPIWGVWDVTLDGTVLDATAYQLRDRRYLDRVDGDVWPRCSDLTEPDEFVISYAYGRRPPVELKQAAAVFVREMAKSCAGLSCELPQRVTSIQREGVSYTILDSQKFIDEGRTGIYQVDLALAAARLGRKRPPGGKSPMAAQTTRARVT